MSQGGTSADFDGGGWSLGTRPRSWSADGHGHGFPEWGRRFFSSGTLQESRATGSAGPRPSGGPDASSEAFSKRRWQRMRARRIHVGPARSQARSSKKITYLTRLEHWHIDVPLIVIDFISSFFIFKNFFRLFLIWNIFIFFFLFFFKLNQESWINIRFLLFMILLAMLYV